MTLLFVLLAIVLVAFFVAVLAQAAPWGRRDRIVEVVRERAPLDDEVVEVRPRRRRVVERRTVRRY